MWQTVLSAFGLDPDTCQISSFGSGLINHTWKVSCSGQEYILQLINTNVFKQPEIIADNLAKLDDFLKTTAPEYLFAAPLSAKDGKKLVKRDGKYYRLSSFILNSHTVDSLSKPAQAYEAAKQFGKFTKLLDGFNPNHLQNSLPDFHNLSLRLHQFRSALVNSTKERQAKAICEIQQVEANTGIADIYEKIVNEKTVPIRVIHHDAKVNNVLFNDHDEGLCVIDLDTIMPGYFISDVGDMMRTYLLDVNEEEQNFSKIKIRTEFFEAIYLGYLEEMGLLLTEMEKELFIYSGKFMIYMQAVRFLTDYLNDDIYYPTHYHDQNLVRAKNQLTLLNQYINSENKFKEIIAQLGQTPANSF